MTKRWLITYESSHWCGAADTHCVVYADSAEEAEDKASEHMANEMLELFSDEYDEHYVDIGELLEENECVYSVTSVEEFGPGHEYWEYFLDPQQSQFFPEV